MKDSSTTVDQAIGSAQHDSSITAIRHLRWGWWSVFTFLALGIILEALHGFKVGSYLSPSNATRRLMWTLAHAHGTLIGLMHLGFACSIRIFPGWPAGRLKLASAAMRAAGVLVPMGFFLGGLQFYKSDPGLGILLVPPGALLLLGSVFLSATHAGGQPGK